MFADSAGIMWLSVRLIFVGKFGSGRVRQIRQVLNVSCCRTYGVARPPYFLPCFVADIVISTDSAAESWRSRRSRVTTACYFLPVI